MSPLRGLLVAGGFAFDPAADPWGAAMLGAAALGALALLVAMGRQFGGRPAGGSGWLLGFSSLAFLGIASTSAAQRARATPPAPAAPQAPAEPVTIEAPAVERDEDDPPPPPTEPPAEGIKAPAPSTEGSALPPPAALPTDPAARKTAVRTVLRDARRTYEDEDTCKSPEDVGKAWAQVKASGATGPRAEAVTRRLEECRRSLRWATTYAVHRDRVDGRDDFAETLAERLAKAHQLKTFIKLSGKDHERMRMGSGKLDDATATAIMSEGLKAELTALGFERVVLASGRRTWKTELEPRSEASYVADKLRPYGLAAPLRLGADQ